MIPFRKQPWSWLEANLKVAQDQYDKDLASWNIDPKSISKDVLDTAKDTVDQAAAALKAAKHYCKNIMSKRQLMGSCWPSMRRSAVMCHRRGTMILTRSYLIRSWSWERLKNIWLCVVMWMRY